MELTRWICMAVKRRKEREKFGAVGTERTQTINSNGNGQWPR